MNRLSIAFCPTECPGKCGCFKNHSHPEFGLFRQATTAFDNKILSIVDDTPLHPARPVLPAPTDLICYFCVIKLPKTER